MPQTGDQIFDIEDIIYVQATVDSDLILFLRVAALIFLLGRLDDLDLVHRLDLQPIDRFIEKFYK